MCQASAQQQAIAWGAVACITKHSTVTLPAVMTTLINVHHSQLHLPVYIYTAV